MRNKLLYLSVIGFGISVGIFIIGVVSAQTATALNDINIQYPIAELENCQSKETCKTYCDAPVHTQACIAYAEKNNLLSKNDIDAAKKFLDAGAKGPGGCTNQELCQKYCDVISHINECVSFAEKTGILPSQQLEEAKQVQAAIAKGIEPPPCKNKKECDVYCDDPGHIKTCVAFGEAAGFLKGNELENAKKMVTALDKGATPPPCKGKEACDAYCSEPDHMEVCMTFAEAAGLMSQQELQDAQKALAAIKKGIKPPACRGREECDAYCTQPEHLDECTKFSVAAGFMSEKDAEMARKTGGKGPGGCLKKEQCDAFCNNPDNQQTCFNFGKDNGLISQEDIQKIEGGKKQFQQSMQNFSSEVSSCIKTVVGSDMFEKLKNGQVMPPQDIGEKMTRCFPKMTPPQGQGMTAGGGSGFPPISSMPQEVKDCVKSAIGENAFGQLRSESIKNEDKLVLFEKAKTCFEKLGPQQQIPSRGMMPNNAFAPGTEPTGAMQGPPPQNVSPNNQFASGTNPNMMPPASQQGIINPGYIQGTSTRNIMPNQYAPGTGPNTPPSSGTPGSNQAQPIPQQPYQQTPPPSSFNNENLFGSFIKLFTSMLGL